MIKHLALLFVLGLTTASMSEVAYTSYNDMMKNPMKVLRNEVVKNTDTSGQYQNCHYIRYWVAKYNFSKSKTHHIFYFIYQCLRKNMEVIRSVTNFGYTRDPKDAHPLPEGCVTPEIETVPKNPCHGGFELGKEIIKDVAKLVTKKLVDHPEDAEVNEEVEGVIDPKNLEKLKQQLPELEELLEDVMKDEHDQLHTTAVPTSVDTTPEGNVVETYKLHDGVTARKVIKPDGSSVTNMTTPEGNEITIMEPSDPSDTTIRETHNPRGKLIQRQEIEPGPRRGYETVTTYDGDEVPVGEPIQRPIAPTDIPRYVKIPPHVRDNFEEAADNFSRTLEKYVSQQVECFAENIIDVQENYLTFVCSTKGHGSIREALRAAYGSEIMCDNHAVNCDALQEELEDQMLHAINNGLDTDNLEVQTGKISTKLVTKDQG